MSKTSQEVYHCPSCGALGEAKSGEGGNKVCSKCGYELRQSVRIAPRSVSQPGTAASGFVQRDVSARRRFADKVEAVVSSPDAVLLPEVREQSAGVDQEYAKQEVVSDDGRKRVVRRRKKRRKTRLAPLLFICAWSVIVMMLIILVRSQMRSDVPVVENESERERRQLEADAAEAIAYVQKHLPDCAASLDGYIKATSPALRAQFIRDPERLSGLMQEYYDRNPPYRPLAAEDPGKETGEEEGALERSGLKNLSFNLYLRDGRKAIETTWQDGAGRVKEVVFMESDGEWKIDWEAFTNYSTKPWVEFINPAEESDPGAEEEVNEGIFRVYYRIHTASTSESIFALKFYPWRPDPAQSLRLRSRTVLVDRDSRAGQRIQFLLDEAAREPELGDSIFMQTDPKGFHRMRARLAWESGESGRRFLHLKEVQAGNWFGLGYEETFPDQLEDRGGAEDPDPGEGGSKAGGDDRPASSGSPDDPEAETDPEPAEPSA